MLAQNMNMRGFVGLVCFVINKRFLTVCKLLLKTVLKLMADAETPSGWNSENQLTSSSSVM